MVPHSHKLLFILNPIMATMEMGLFLSFDCFAFNLLVRQKGKNPGIVKYSELLTEET